MSSLIFYTDAEQILVVTDTLSATANGPLLFTSKAHYLPHLKTIVAGTGVGGFSVEWALTANSRMVLSGIENLDFHTPEGLRKLWSTYKQQYTLPEGMTTTVYQFGISEDTDMVRAFAYRSTNNFASEVLNHGIGVKPECAVPEGNLLEHIRSMMNEQREVQSRKPPDQRTYIGGEAIAIHLTKSACTFSHLFAFDDFKSDQAEILSTYEKNRR